MFNLEKIKEEYPYLTELHAHTFPCSPCGTVSPEDTVKLYIEAGCTSLVITNHMCEPYFSGEDHDALVKKLLEPYYRAKEAAKGTSLSVILGCELRFFGDSNDYLIYGICEEDIKTLLSSLPLGIEKFYRSFKNDKNIIIQAHPMRKSCKLAPLDCIDGIEAFNLHPYHNSRVALAAQHAVQNGMILTGGSDFHEEGHHGLCLTRTKKPLRDSYDVADMLRSKDFVLDISGNILIPYHNN